MKTGQYIDYHIELSSVRNFANELILKNVIPIDGNEILNDLKNVVINSNIRPFLLSSETGSEGYYKKYVRLEQEYAEKTIPDFFSHAKNFYDLDEQLNISRHNIDVNSFQRLFVLKMMEVDQAKLKLNHFFDFQFYDNFYGDIENIGIFLQKILSKDSVCYLLPAIAVEIRQWLSKNKLSYLEQIFNSSEEDALPDETSQSEKDFREVKKNFEIAGNMTIEEIRHYFSFLYKEVRSNSKYLNCQPFLPEEAVNQIFENGMVIPANPLEPKFKLNIEPRFPKKIVDYAIHQFFNLHSITKRDMADYVLFFANYIEDYEKALISPDALKAVRSNITGERSPKDRIKWEGYIGTR
jgi:hypothetical protein